MQQTSIGHAAARVGTQNTGEVGSATRIAPRPNEAAATTTAVPFAVLAQKYR